MRYVRRLQVVIKVCSKAFMTEKTLQAQCPSPCSASLVNASLSEFYEGRLEKRGFSKLRKVRGGGGGRRTNIEGLRRDFKRD